MKYNIKNGSGSSRFESRINSRLSESYGSRRSTRLQRSHGSRRLSESFRGSFGHFTSELHRAARNNAYDPGLAEEVAQNISDTLDCIEYVINDIGMMDIEDLEFALQRAKAILNKVDQVVNANEF